MAVLTSTSACRAAAPIRSSTARRLDHLHRLQFEVRRYKSNEGGEKKKWLHKAIFSLHGRSQLSHTNGLTVQVRKGRTCRRIRDSISHAGCIAHGRPCL